MRGMRGFRVRGVGSAIFMKQRTQAVVLHKFEALYSGLSEVCPTCYAAGDVEQRNGKTGSNKDWCRPLFGIGVAAGRGMAKESAPMLNWEPPPHHQIGATTPHPHCTTI